jgi:hypothetical protein
MRGNEFRMELRELVNRHSIDTELDAPDWLIAEKIESFLVIIKQFSTHAGYTPLNNMVGTPSASHNSASPKCNHDMHWREQYICAVCGYVSISQPRGCGCTSGE